MHKNRMRGAKGGRAGNWPRSPQRSKPGSVNPAVVPRRLVSLSQEINALPPDNWWLGRRRRRPNGAQKLAGRRSATPPTPPALRAEGRERRLERRPERCARVGTGKQRASKPKVAVRARGPTGYANAGASEPNRDGEAAPGLSPSVQSERANPQQESAGQTCLTHAHRTAGCGPACPVVLQGQPARAYLCQLRPDGRTCRQ